MQTVIDRFPEIGKQFRIMYRNVMSVPIHGHRSGVLTFDGNIHVKKKATYSRIREHLQIKYHHHFSYGTVVQL